MSDASMPQDLTGIPPAETVPPAYSQPADAVGEGARGTAIVWSRFVARHIDLILYSALIAGAIFLMNLSNLVPKSAVVRTLITLPVALLIEVPIMGFFGSTVGKLIFRISVRRPDGSKLSFGDVCRRNIILWAVGFGLGVPGLYILCPALCYRAAKEGRPSKWDAAAGYVVRQARVSRARWALGLILFIGMFIAVAAATVWADYVDNAPPSPAFAWRNPHTGLTVQIPPGWHEMSDMEKQEAGSSWFAFRSSVVAMIPVELQTDDLDGYIRILHRNPHYGTFDRGRDLTLTGGVKERVLEFHTVSSGSPFQIEVRVWKGATGLYWRCSSYVPAAHTKEIDAASSLAAVLVNSTMHGGDGR